MNHETPCQLFRGDSNGNIYMLSVCCRALSLLGLWLYGPGNGLSLDRLDWR